MAKTKTLGGLKCPWRVELYFKEEAKFLKLLLNKNPKNDQESFE